MLQRTRTLFAASARAHAGQVDSPDSLENVETKWVGEIAENCPNVKLVLVALKCDLRKRDDDDEEAQPEKPMIQYDEGLKVAEKIKALRYLGMSIDGIVRAPN
jgi:Rho family protein